MSTNSYSILLAYRLDLQFFIRHKNSIHAVMLAQKSTSVLGSSLAYLDIVADCSGQLIVKILDIQGKWAKTIKETVVDGVQKLSINVDDLKNGNYVMNVFNDFGFVKSVRYTKG